MSQSSEYQLRKESQTRDKKVRRVSRHVIRNVTRGKDEMPAVPGLQIPVLYDRELDAVQANLERQGIGVAMSEESHRTDDTGARLCAKKL